MVTQNLYRTVNSYTVIIQIKEIQSTDKWIKKMCSIYKMDYCHKKQRSMIACYNMDDLENILLSKGN